MEQLALQETCPEIRKIGAQLVAITPGKKPLPARTPTRTGRCADGCHGPAVRGTLSVLWDQGNRVAHLFGLKDDFSVATKDLYRAAAVDIEEINGAEAGWTLPLASTYIIDRTSVIRHAVVTADWRIPRDPNDTLKRLKELVADQFLRAALGFVTCSMPRTWALRRRIRIVHLVRLRCYGSFHPANVVQPPHQLGRIAESTYIAEPKLDGWRLHIHRGQRWHRRNLEETFDALRPARGETAPAVPPGTPVRSFESPIDLASSVHGSKSWIPLRYS